LHFNSNGLPNLQNSKNGSLIYSKHDPIKESNRFSETILNEYSSLNYTPSTMICFGFGMGYHIESLLQKSGGKIRLACVEPDQSILEIPEVKKKF